MTRRATRRHTIAGSLAGIRTARTRTVQIGRAHV